MLKPLRRGRFMKMLTGLCAPGFWVGTLLVLSASLLTSSFALVPVKPIIAAVSKFSLHAKALPDDEIARLARIAGEAKGTKTVGKILGAQNLPNDVLEDAYVRIAVQQNRLSREEAEGMFERLRGTQGFRRTLAKVIGNGDAMTTGHLNELRIADNAAQHGFRVQGIGVLFSDGVKGAPTDIDVVLEKAGKVIAMEAKDYSPTTPIPLEEFRADMVSLSEYALRQAPRRVISVFSLTIKPSSATTLRILEKEADRHGIQLLFGTPEQLVEQVKQLHAIL